MLQILSSLNLVTRLEMIADETLLSGLTSDSKYFSTGTWAQIDTDSTTGNGKAKKPTAAGKFCMPIWTESNRDKRGGWSPDVAVTGQVTVIYGKLHAITDQYSTSPSGPAVGDALSVSADGKLKKVESTEIVVAYCTKAPFNTTYLGKSCSAIEFVTV